MNSPEIKKKIVEDWENYGKEFREFEKDFYDCWNATDLPNPENVKMYMWDRFLELLAQERKKLAEELEKELQDFRKNCRRLEETHSPIQILDTSKNFFISKIKPLLQKNRKTKGLSLKGMPAQFREKK